MRIALLLPLLLLPPQDSWWNDDWSARRAVTVRNTYEDGPLPAGFQVRMPIDPDFLEIRSRKDLADLVMTYDEKEIPSFAERVGKRVHVWFRVQKEIPARRHDPKYALYFDNPAAARTPDPGKVFDFFEDFSGKRPESLDIDDELETSVENGALVVTEVPTRRVHQAPAGIRFKDLPKLSWFACEFTLRLEPAPGTACSAGLTVRMKEESKADEELKKKIEELVDALGSSDWEAREEATRSLIEIGKPAVPLLEEAAATDDAEVRWRANHVLEEIRERNPARSIEAEVRATGASPPGERRFHVARSSGKYTIATAPPYSFRLKVSRDQDGDVTILWNGSLPDPGRLEGEVDAIGFQFTKSNDRSLGRILIDDIRVWQTFDDASRPATEIQVEEKRP